MDLATDNTNGDIEVFLQEADENLQALDEDIVRLEREQDNPELLQEIFRLAHTFKGSAAMLGYRQMADLAHGMESLLDLVRQGNVLVTTQLIDALLHSLDLLRALRDSLANSQDPEVDIAPTVAELEALMISLQSSPASDGASTAANKKSQPVPSLDQMATQRLQTAQITGQNLYSVKVDLIPNSPWNVVRCFQVVQALSLLGDIISSFPSEEDIEAERVGSAMQVVLATEHESEAVLPPLEALPDVVLVTIDPYSPPEESSDTKEGNNGEAASPTSNYQPQTVRIEVDRLDHLMNTIGELVIDRTRILQIGRVLAARYKEDDLIQALGETSAHVGKVVDELQEDIMKARMLPIGTVFTGFPRLVRDLAQNMGKRVDFTIEGQDTELDRTVIQHIRDPLLHLLRNAVDHGMEPPEKRRVAGKPPAGSVGLSAFQQQGHIMITVQDDGGGIDADAVRQSAISRGIISADVASRLSDSEAIDLIFMPGASTAEKTTDISGRGVGLDIVKTKIESINGFVNVETKVGAGTKFTLMLPLTLATIQALLFSVNGAVLAAPLIYVLEAVKLEPRDISTIEGREVTRLRDKVIPLLRLEAVFDRSNPRNKPTTAYRQFENTGEEMVTGKSRSPEEGTDYTYVVIVKAGEQLFGLVVDYLMDLQEVTVKSLSNYMGQVKGIAGVSILGDGQIVLNLDLPTLIGSSIHNSAGLNKELTLQTELV